MPNNGLSPLPASAGRFQVPDGLEVPRRRFSHLYLNDSNRSDLQQFVREWSFRETLDQYGFRVDQTLLFRGPPGNGKTATAEALAGEIGYEFECVEYTNIIHSYVGETPKAIKSQFDRRNVVMLLDECDSLVSRRQFGRDPGGAGRGANDAVNQVLRCIDRMHASIVVIFATNAKDDNLDGAFARRMGRKLFFGPPDAAGLAWLLEQISLRHPMIPEEIIQSVGAEWPNFAECERAALQAARKWLLSQLMSGRKV